MAKEKTQNHLTELDAFKGLVMDKSQVLLGYPCNLKYDYEPIMDFFKYSLNNVGDPFIDSNYQVSSRKFEREVLSFFAKLYKIKKNDYWGYVTSGGTEGNMFGLFLARELYPNGVLYSSDDSHYSIHKIARVLRMKHVNVCSTENGQIDLQSLDEDIRVRREYPVILNVNIGTTMKGAIDNLDEILRILKRNRVSNYYIHCDAALFGMLLPFLKNAPRIDFTRHIDSIAISGHKFIGAPFPCGIVLVRQTLREKIARRIEYIGSIDSTISGSRSGHAPLLLWYAIKTRGANGFKKEANECINNAQVLYEKLQKINYPCFLNDFSNTVCFKQPNEKFVKKWQLAVQNGLAHVIVMQHVDLAKINELVQDLEESLQGT